MGKVHDGKVVPNDCYNIVAFYIKNISTILFKGVFYDPDKCVSYEFETVPQECQRGSDGYTCLGDCKEKLPLHCDRKLNILYSNHNLPFSMIM